MDDVGAAGFNPTLHQKPARGEGARPRWGGRGLIVVLAQARGRQGTSEQAVREAPRPTSPPPPLLLAKHERLCYSIAMMLKYLQQAGRRPTPFLASGYGCITPPLRLRDSSSQLPYGFIAPCYAFCYGFVPENPEIRLIRVTNIQSKTCLPPDTGEGTSSHNAALFRAAAGGNGVICAWRRVMQRFPIKRLLPLARA